MSKDLFTHLILRSFQGNLSKEEKETLDKWLAEDTSHMDTFNKLKVSWEKSEDYKSDFEVDLDKGWNAIQSKISSEEVRVTPIVPIWRRPAMRVAASIALLVGISWTVLNLLNFNDSSQDIMAHITQIDEVKEVTLPDGSIAWLNENSSLKYEQDFNIRDIELDGEAQFKVKHDASHPFTVSAGGTKTTVLGTTFNVHSDADKGSVEVSLIEGKVSCVSPEKVEVILQPGETALYNKSLGSLSRIESVTPNFNSWQTRNLSFEENVLSDVIKDMEDYFDLDIQLETKGEEQCLFTGTFTDPSYADVIEVLAFTFDLNQIDNDGNPVIVVNNCK